LGGTNRTGVSVTWEKLRLLSVRKKRRISNQERARLFLWEDYVGIVGRGGDQKRLEQQEWLEVQKTLGERAQESKKNG